MRTIAVFGSASPQAGDKDYQQAEEIGRKLAQAGFAVSSGGYVGTMEAVSKGAAEAGGHVIGVTCTAIENIREGQKGANRWVAEEISFETLRERMLYLVLNNDGIIVLPGGIGTLVEMSMAWNLIQVGEIAARPLVLLGDLWRDTIDTFVQPAYVRPQDAPLVTLAPTTTQAVQVIVQQIG